MRNSVGGAERIFFYLDSINFKTMCSYNILTLQLEIFSHYVDPFLNSEESKFQRKAVCNKMW